MPSKVLITIVGFYLLIIAIILLGKLLLSALIKARFTFMQVKYIVWIYFVLSILTAISVTIYILLRLI
ncbi:hypothetical protein BHU72_08050 [Desulfuribacillus stibiiarsenatis]|uniref:Uncharacterized protein n=1 Tax=Desulfuribacillus stibiiarsenatis TaxID=1390249 RepID=A0A1E5L3W1_9FIRM|nr:hypothetical protein BHU72_08050 [Desulfuribacillus stibiiarsenatis]